MHPRQGAPACPASRPAMQRECMLGALVRFHDPRGLHHRRAEVLEPFGGISFTDDAGEDSDARAAMLGQAEAVITSRSGLGTPRWRSASAWAWPTVAATPEEPPVSSTGRVQGRGGWLAEGGMPPELGPASSLLDPLRDHALVGTCGDAQLGRALAPGSSSLLSLAPSKMPATSASRSARLPATSRSSVAAAAISGSVGLRQRACRLATPSRRATSRRSGGGSGAIRS